MASTSTDRVSGFSSSLALKTPARLATTANITLSGFQTIDGVLPTSSEHVLFRRILVKNQTTASENGIYTMSTGTWERVKDFDSATDICTGTRVYVWAGTVGQGTYVISTSINQSTFAFGTDSIAFESATEADLTFGLLDAINRHGSDITSASTIDLDAATGDIVDVTGSVTIGTITLGDGTARWVRFTGALTLTHSSTLVLPGSQDILTAAGDYALFIGYASSVVRCAHYMRVNSHPLIAGYTTIAAAATVDLGSKREQSIGVTGASTASISSFGTAAPVGAVKFLSFASTNTVAHSTSAILLRGAANLPIDAGACMTVRLESTAGLWRELHFSRAAGRTINSAYPDTLTAGFSATSYSNGTVSSGTLTPSSSNGNIQHVTNGGGHALAPPSATCSIALEYTNSTAPGTVTTTGFNGVTGSPSTVASAVSVAMILKTNSFSLLTWKTS